MSTLVATLQVTAQLLILMAVGAAVERKVYPVSRLMAFCATVLTPAFIFSKLYSMGVSLNDVVEPFCLASGGMLITALVLHRVLILRSPEASDSLRDDHRLSVRSAIISASIPNTGNFGLPLAAALASAAENHQFGVGVTANHVFSVQAGYILAANIMLWLVTPFYLFGRRGASQDSPPIWRSLPSPLLGLATVLVVNAFHIVVPSQVQAAIDTVAGAAVPMLLFSLGGLIYSLRRTGTSSFSTPIVLPVLAKLVFLPFLTFMLCKLLVGWPYPGVIAVLSSAAPSAIFSANVTARNGGDTSGASARIILWTTLLSILTLPMVTLLNGEGEGK